MPPKVIKLRLVLLRIECKNALRLSLIRLGSLLRETSEASFEADTHVYRLSLINWETSALKSRVGMATWHESVRDIIPVRTCTHVQD